VDTSGRNLTAGAARPAPTLTPRTIYVTVLHPVDSSGAPLAEERLHLRLRGEYRVGSTPAGCDASQMITNTILVCVGFPLMDASAINWADIPNHPGDITRVLDAILADPTLVGGVHPDRILYEGGSMGAITGMYLVHPESRETRIDAIVASAGMAPPWIPAFSDPEVWATAPPILMINTLDDTIIPYELARTTVTNANSSSITLVTGFTGGHANPGACESVGAYRQVWIDHHIVGEAAPSASVLTDSGCAALGIQPGGTTGYGTAATLAP
jgi:hypothetical protein